MEMKHNSPLGPLAQQRRCDLKVLLNHGPQPYYAKAIQKADASMPFLHVSTLHAKRYPNPAALIAARGWGYLGLIYFVMIMNCVRDIL